MPPVLGYWNIRGLAQPIRLMLEYLGEEYEDKRYNHGPAPTFDKSLWTSVKYTLGLEPPNLPYFIDGDIKMTQSNAIMRHFARKHNLGGRTEAEHRRIDMLENMFMDIRIRWAMTCYFFFDDKKDDYIKEFRETLKTLSKSLGDQPWLMGERITYIDFMLYEILDIHLKLDDTFLKDTKNLQDYHKRFEDLPAIKKYMASDKFVKWPINGPDAKFASQ